MRKNGSSSTPVSASFGNQEAIAPTSIAIESMRTTPIVATAQASTKPTTASHQIMTDTDSCIPRLAISDVTNHFALVQLRISGALLTRYGARTLLHAFGNHMLSALPVDPYPNGTTESALALWETRIMPILLGTYNDQSAFKWVWVSEQKSLLRQVIQPISFAELVEIRPEYGYFGLELSSPEFKEPEWWRWLINLWTPKPSAELATTNWDNILTRTMPISRYGDARRYLGLQLTSKTLLSVRLGGRRGIGRQSWNLLKEFDRENKWSDDFTFNPRNAEDLQMESCMADRFRGGTSLRILFQEFYEVCRDDDLTVAYQSVPNAISWPLPFVITDSLQSFLYSRCSCREKYRRMCRTAFGAFHMDRLLGFRAIQEVTKLIHELCDLVAIFLGGPQAGGIFLPTLQNRTRSPSSWITDERIGSMQSEWLVPVAVEELTQVMNFGFRPLSSN